MKYRLILLNTYSINYGETYLRRREKKKTRNKETELNFLVHSGSYGSQDCARSKLGTKYSIQSPSEWPSPFPPPRVYITGTLETEAIIKHRHVI